MRAESLTARELPVPLDAVLPSAWFVALLAGLVMVASASMDLGAAMYADAFHFVWRHGAYLLAGCCAFAIVVCIPLATVRALSGLVMLATFAMLVAVLSPALGREVNGASRWVGIGGLSVQASEVARIGVLIWFAAVLARNTERETTGAGPWVAPLVVLLACVALLLAEPDFGTAVVVAAACFSMAFLAGLRLRWLIGTGLAGTVGFAILAVAQPYRVERLLSFREPFADQFGAGYQLVQALIAFGRGEWFGLGLGRSIQKAFFLPEAHNDFLVAVIAEELGIVGVMAVAALLALIVARMMAVGARALARDERFGGLLVVGSGTLLALQTVVSIGVNSGGLPTKGITLPFFSYGGNSLIVCCALVAVAVRTDYENRAVDVRPRGRRTRAARGNRS